MFMLHLNKVNKISLEMMFNTKEMFYFLGRSQHQRVECKLQIYINSRYREILLHAIKIKL